MADEKLAALLDGTLSSFAAGALTGNEAAVIAGARDLAEAHRPVQLYGSADDCPHPRPEIHPGATGAELEAWDEWDEAHPPGLPVVEGNDDPGRYCEERPLSMACPGCTEIVQQATGDDTGDPVPAGECMVRPLLTRHLTGEEAPGA